MIPFTVLEMDVDTIATAVVVAGSRGGRALQRQKEPNYIQYHSRTDGTGRD